MQPLQSALISVFYKDGILPLAQTLKQFGIIIYSTGGTLTYLQENGIECVAAETVTGYPSILGGRVKTLHPKIFGGILGRRDNETDVVEMATHQIPTIDLVVVDLYPFEETVKNTNEEALIIEKIDIGGPSMLRAAAKNYKHIAVLSNKETYSNFITHIKENNGATTIEFRRQLAAQTFYVVAQYDIAINDYFNPNKTLRYGENPHQQAYFKGDLSRLFTQLHGKELSYNNLVDVDAAVQLLVDINKYYKNESFFGIIKHTNVCGAALSNDVLQSWNLALAGDPESAFGGILVCNQTINNATAQAINELFFEVLIAVDFNEDALKVLQTKKNRILLKIEKEFTLPTEQSKSILNGTIHQQTDELMNETWDNVGGRKATETEQDNAQFANLLCKHLKSNAIALVTNKQLIGKGCGQTSRIDSLKQSISKAQQFGFNLQQAVLASDAFFPFNDCVSLAHQQGITCFIQPGGSIRDKDSIDYCVQHNLAMIITGTRHFKH